MTPEPRIFAIVPAAGSSSRMQSERPKILLPLAGEVVVSRTLRLLAMSHDFHEIVVPTSREIVSEVDTVVDEVQPRPVVIEGGATRQQSVAHAVTWLQQHGAQANDLVVVHDAARCFVSVDVVRRCVAAAREFKAATAATPIVDTLVRSDREEMVGQWLDRSAVWSVQTPQVFTFELLARAHAEASADATDDSSIVALFHPVKLVWGARENIKLTTRADLEFAERFLIR